MQTIKHKIFFFFIPLDFHLIALLLLSMQCIYIWYNIIHLNECKRCYFILYKYFNGPFF